MLGNFIAERRQSRQSRRTYCPRKVFDFAAAFGGVANNFVVCNRGQYNILKIQYKTAAGKPAAVIFYHAFIGHTSKYAFISSAEALTLPCIISSLPPPLPHSAEFISLDFARMGTVLLAIT